VRGSVDTVTAWVPMQDTNYLQGCLAVMPRSHTLGLLEHDMKVLGKRHYPSHVFDREVRYVEMNKGDVLLFHSCLLHSSSLNLSNAIRFSVQARYARVGERVDEGMGGIIPLAARA
jgi:ectoine hydroxylase-related dioxygenase (phytanoyl-CoA dioxygenase family)